MVSSSSFRCGKVKSVVMGKGALCSVPVWYVAVRNFNTGKVWSSTLRLLAVGSVLLRQVGVSWSSVRCGNEVL